MPNRTDASEQLPVEGDDLTAEDLTVEDLTRCIKQWLEEDERSTAWLAKKVGMADSTLRFQLDDRPDRLIVANWLAIMVALGRTWGDVRRACGLPEEAAAA